MGIISIVVDVHAIDEDMDGYSSDLDCNDQNSAINPAATEICDGLDNNCDGAVDDNEHNAPTWYADVDADGYGTGGRVLSRCIPADGYVGKDGDCNDADRTVSPLAKEINDGKDNDCDGEIDEGLKGPEKPRKPSKLRLFYQNESSK